MLVLTTRLTTQQKYPSFCTLDTTLFHFHPPEFEPRLQTFNSSRKPSQKPQKTGVKTLKSKVKSAKGDINDHRIVKGAGHFALEAPIYDENICAWSHRFIQNKILPWTIDHPEDVDEESSSSEKGDENEAVEQVEKVEQKEEKENEKVDDKSEGRKGSSEKGKE